MLTVQLKGKHFNFAAVPYSVQYTVIYSILEIFAVPNNYLVISPPNSQDRC